MKAGIKDIIFKALSDAASAGQISQGARYDSIMVEAPKKPEFGDFSTNVAMLIAKAEKRNPRELAGIISERIAASGGVARCEVAGPGFINIFLGGSYWLDILARILAAREGFGRIDLGRGKKVQVEFVSANPTGPLHIGHGRGAAVGDALSNVLKAAGFDVTKEFYINDVGRQTDVLGRSVFLRYLERLGKTVTLPEDLYKGAYIKDVAADFASMYGEAYKDHTEAAAIPVFKEFAMKAMLELIKKDLRDFGVEFDVWYSERSLHERGLIHATIADLKKRGVIYDEEGALWFRTTDFGDDKDRVLIKADGSMTYFASDIAYHREKLDRGFDEIIDVWGADHHGYEGRIRALLKALGKNDKALDIIFIQLVALLRDGVPVAMGKREGEFVTLRQVMDEVGKDACRFFFLMRRSDAQLDFDLELAKRQAPENPVFYVQYCYARIQSIFGFAKEQGISTDADFDAAVLSKLEDKDELDIIKHLAAFPEVLERSALDKEPHRITFYAMELAGLFHPYYNKNRIVTEDLALTKARLLLCGAISSVVESALGLLGVSAPAKM